MTTCVSSKGQIVLPAEMRREDGIRPGHVFEIDRRSAGDYHLRLKRSGRSRKGLARLLLSCPEKNWFCPVASNESTDSVCPSL